MGSNQRVQVWRLDHLSDYADALPWLHTSAHVIDTTYLNPAQPPTLCCATFITTTSAAPRHRSSADQWTTAHRPLPSEHAEDRLVRADR